MEGYRLKGALITDNARKKKKKISLLTLEKKDPKIRWQLSKVTNQRWNQISKLPNQSSTFHTRTASSFKTQLHFWQALRWHWSHWIWDDSEVQSFCPTAPAKVKSWEFFFFLIKEIFPRSRRKWGYRWNAAVLKVRIIHNNTCKI